MFYGTGKTVSCVSRNNRCFPSTQNLLCRSELRESRQGDGANPERQAPFFFSKPADAVCPEGTRLPFPLATENLHHEIELVIAIRKKGTYLLPEDALDYLFGYAVGLDLTRRDLQSEAKKKGRPWATAKGFDNSAPCSSVHSVS